MINIGLALFLLLPLLFLLSLVVCAETLKTGGKQLKGEEVFMH